MVFIILDTKDSYTGESHNASFNLTTYTTGSSSNSKISLQSVILPNLVYPVNSNNNVVILLEDGNATEFTATLTPGSYTATQIATELKTQLDAAGANTYTVTYDDKTLKLTITTSGTSLKFGSTSTALKIIGFPATTSFAASQVSSYPIRLDGSQYLDLICSLPANNIVSDNVPVYHRIPLNVSFGSVLFYSPNYEVALPLKSDAVITVDLRLVDDDGNAFVMPANTNIQYIFKMVE